MAGADDRLALTGSGGGEQLGDCVGVSAIQARGRLVDEDQAGRRRQGAGQRHPLGLARREAGDPLARALAQADAVKQLGRPALGCPG